MASTKFVDQVTPIVAEWLNEVDAAVFEVIPFSVQFTSPQGAAKLPAGTTAERPSTPVEGHIRFNTTLEQYEGYNGTSWGTIGGGASGAPNNAFMYEHDKTVTADYTMTANKNSVSAGPITIANGVTVTIPNNSTWVIV